MRDLAHLTAKVEAMNVIYQTDKSKKAFMPWARDIIEERKDERLLELIDTSSTVAYVPTFDV